MNEYKKQGQQHHRNKTKYKDHAKFAAKTTGQQKKELPDHSLPKNWSRYDEIEDDDLLEEEETVSSKDFGVLSQAHVSRGAYFQFKHDRQFLPDNATDVEIASDLFQLDLNVLGLGIASIPFHERMGMDAKIFQPQHMEELISTAARNRMTFDAFIGGHAASRETVAPKKSTTTELVDMIDSVDIYDDVEKTHSESEAPKSKDVEELEDWLDDILG